MSSLFAPYLPRGRRPYLLPVDLANFSGGLNLRDAPSELAPNETPACLNVTLDERGGLAARLGITSLNAGSLLPAAPGYLYYSAVAGAVLAYISTTGGAGKLYKSTDGGATWSAAYSLFTAGASGWIVDFKNRVVVGNSVDGVYSFPSGLGAPTHTAGGTNAMETPTGSCGAVWQNKIWVGGLSGANRPRLMMCAAGDETSWNTGGGVSNFVDLRDVDDEQITAIGVGQGVDITGKPSMVVYKQHSVYRVDDSTTGAYVTLHAKGAGAAGANAVASNLGAVCSVNDRGIWVTDGTAIPERASDKLAPLFTKDGLNLATMAGWTAVQLGDRVIFNVARNGSSTNNLQLEYHPAVGWIVPHTGMSLSAATVYTSGTRKTFAAHVSSGAVYEVGKGGTDDGTSVACSWQSRWVRPVDGYQARLRRMLLSGRGAFNVYVRTDFSQGQGNQYSFDASTVSNAFVWGAGAWGTGVWGDSLYETTLPFACDEICRDFSLVISKTVSASTNAPALLGDGVAPEVGAFALYGIHVDFAPLWWT